MKYALINPNWTFQGSAYFGCREPHLPLEYGYAKCLLEQEGHQAFIIDAQLECLDMNALRERVRFINPDIIVVTTAPSYLFWRCPQPELRAPQETIRALRDEAPIIIAIGPHGSVTPGITLKKLGSDAVIMGEPESVLPRFDRMDRSDWNAIPSICYVRDGEIVVQGEPSETRMDALPPLRWPDEIIRLHLHNHHRFDSPATGPGAEVESSRGCAFSCSFCARSGFRNKYRKRPLNTVLSEIDGLLAHGVQYIYFIDEIFLPDMQLIKALSARRCRFGVQTRIDIWKPDMLDRLGNAGCVSVEAGVESISTEGRALLNKNCSLSTEKITDLLIRAKSSIPFVQATLMDCKADDAVLISGWREQLSAAGIWSNEPVPLFPYPGSAEYFRRWGPPDESAWERAHEYYLASFANFSDIQEDRPLPLQQLELNQ